MSRERTEYEILSDALVGVMLTEAEPDAFSQQEGDAAWAEALAALQHHIPDSTFGMVKDAARQYREGRIDGGASK